MSENEEVHDCDFCAENYSVQPTCGNKAVPSDATSHTESRMFYETSWNILDLDRDVGLAISDASTVSMLEALKA